MIKLFLHIGTEKTGTSTLQTFLLENERNLNEQGFSFYCNPEKSYFYGNGRSWGGHFPLVASFSDDWPSDYLSHEKFVRSKTALHDLVNDIKTERRHAILSAEHFSAKWTSREPLDGLKAALQDFDVSILIYVRPQEELLTSSYGTSIQAGNTHRFGVKNTMSSDIYYNYAMLADLWASVFGKENIIVRDYKALQDGDIRRDVLSTIGLADRSAFVFGDNINTSLGLRHINALRIMNQFLPRSWDLGSDAERQFISVVRHELSQLSLPNDGKISALLSGRQVAKIRALFRDSNRYLRDTYGLGSLDTWDVPPAAAAEPLLSQQATRTDLAFIAVELAKAATLLKLQNATLQKKLADQQDGAPPPS